MGEREAGKEIFGGGGGGLGGGGNVQGIRGGGGWGGGGAPPPPSPPTPPPPLLALLVYPLSPLCPSGHQAFTTETTPYSPVNLLRPGDRLRERTERNRVGVVQEKERGIHIRIHMWFGRLLTEMKAKQKWPI